MGFWDAVGSLAKGAANSALDAAKELKRLKEEYEYKSDSDLAHIARTKSGTQKIAAFAVLKERGYTGEDVRHL